MGITPSPKYSLPTLDIAPLRNVCLADTGIRMHDSFIGDVIKLESKGKWTHSKCSHREYKENKGYRDPNGIEKIDLDHRVIVRQLKSTIKQETQLGMYGNIHDNSDKVSVAIREALGSKAQYFSNMMMLKFNSDQGLIPHKDGVGVARLYIPIYPFGEDYSRLEFYWENQIYYLYNYISPPPIYLFSSKVIHSVFNQGYPTRLNLQVTCDLPYEEAVEMFNES